MIDKSNESLDLSKDDWEISYKQRKPEIAELPLVERIKVKFKANPFVPIGCLVTTGFLIEGLRQFKNSNSKKQQLMMRGRVAAQIFTVVAISLGLIYFEKK